MQTGKLNTYFNDFVFQQRSFYETVASVAYLRNDRSKFLNLGYKGNVPIKVLQEDATDELSMNLYFKTLEGVDMNMVQRSLEIGCGRGGGCYILKKYFRVPDVSGLDMTYFNLQNAKCNTAGMGVHFLHGNILKDPPHLANKYDLLLSVDTCQTYQDFDSFLKNIRSYLAPNSVIAYSDFAFEEDMETFKKLLEINNFEITLWDDLTDAMSRSISTGDAQEKILPLWQRALLGKKLQRYLVWSSSEIDSLLNSGELRYIKFIAKPVKNT